jgi:hypothetical protein
MGFKLSKFKSKLVEATYACDDEELRLWIDPDILTPNFLAEMESLARSAKESTEQADSDDPLSTFAPYKVQMDFFIGILSRVIKRWDATDDDNNPLSPSPEVLGSLNIDKLTDLFEVCMGAASPKKPETEATSESQTTPETTPHTSGVLETSDASPAS